MTDNPENRYNVLLLMAAAIVASAVSAPAFALTALSPASCSAISDAVARLSCFDRLFPASSPQSASKVTEACIDGLKQTLKSPSTFQLVNATVDPVRLSVDEYKDRELIRIRDSYDADTASAHRVVMLDIVDDIRSKANELTLFDVTITYDAQNGFGAMLRGRAACSVVSLSGNEDDFLAETLTVRHR